MLQKINKFGWELLPHSLYSSSIAPRDFHLFLAFQIFLLREKLKFKDKVQRELSSFFFTSKPEVYPNGIKKATYNIAKNYS